MKLRLNDNVQILSGKDNGRTGKITRVLSREGRVIVEGLNQYKRHLKKRSDKQPGGIVAIERAIAVAKVALICPSCKKPTRIGFQTLKTGEKLRLCKKCGGQLDTKPKK